MSGAIMSLPRRSTAEPLPVNGCHAPSHGDGGVGQPVHFQETVGTCVVSTEAGAEESLSVGWKGLSEVSRIPPTYSSVDFLQLQKEERMMLQNGDKEDHSLMPFNLSMRLIL